MRRAFVSRKSFWDSELLYQERAFGNSELLYQERAFRNPELLYQDRTSEKLTEFFEKTQVLKERKIELSPKAFKIHLNLLETKNQIKIKSTTINFRQNFLPHQTRKNNTN